MQNNEMVMFFAVLMLSGTTCIIATVILGMPSWGALPLGMLFGLAAGDTHRLWRKRQQRRERS